MRTYITPRDTEYVICRMGMIYITAGEPFYLRQLILNRTGRTFDDFKTVVDITLPTYQDACYALGIIEAKEEAKLCLEQNILFATPSELRSLFVMLTVQGFPTIAAYNDDTIRHAMSIDYSVRLNEAISSDGVVNELLIDLQDRFVSMGRSLDFYGLPMPQRCITELERESKRYKILDQQQLYTELNTKYPNNQQQQQIMSEIIDIMEDSILTYISMILEYILNSNYHTGVPFRCYGVSFPYV